MDIMEARELYYVLMSETRPERRDEAYRRLSGSNDEELKGLAESGKTVFEVMTGKAKPPALESVLKRFESMPLADIWSGFAEATGQVLLLHAFSMPKDGDCRAEIISFGLRFVSKAQDGGFPVSETTIGYVNSAGEAEPKLKNTAQAIIRQNSTLVPERPFRERPSGFPPKNPGREAKRV
ncbi:MAG: hypothetical protein V1861_01265 [Candidatus Micrarchaeota archaeon]